MNPYTQNKIIADKITHDQIRLFQSITVNFIEAVPDECMADAWGMHEQNVPNLRIRNIGRVLTVDAASGWYPYNPSSTWKWP
jgi:hypothetical protein